MKNNACIPLVFLCLLTGCVTETIPPADIYTILPEWGNSKTQTEGQTNSSLTIKLAQVRAPGAITGTEILYTDAHYGRNSYAYSRWNDAPSILMQTLFQVALEESGLFKAVVPPTSVAETDLLLESTLLDLSHHVKDDGTSEGVIRVRFYLIDNKTDTVSATQAFVSRVPASTKNAQGAVEALNQAATKVAHQLVNWLAEPGKLLNQSTKCSASIPANCHQQANDINQGQ